LAIEHVEYGKEADPDHQNSIIDQVNINVNLISALDSAVADLELQIIGKAELCTDLPVDTGEEAAVGLSDKASPCDHRHKAVGSADPLAPTATAAPGTATLASREDHVHPAVSQLLAGANITLDPAEGKGAVTITAAGGTAIQTKEYAITPGTYSGEFKITLETFNFASVLLGITLTLEAEAGVGANDAWAAIYDSFNDQYNYWTSALEFEVADGRITLSTAISGRAEGEIVFFTSTQAVVFAGGIIGRTLKVYSGKVTVYYL